MADTVGAAKYAIAHSRASFLFGGFIYPIAIGYIKDQTGNYTIGFIAVIFSGLILNFIIPLLSIK